MHNVHKDRSGLRWIGQDSVLHRPSGEGMGFSFWNINEMNFI